MGWGITKHVTQQTGILPEGKTTSGWSFVYGVISISPPGTNRAQVGFWHGLINDPPKEVDSTFCIDDLVFGKTVK